MEGLGEGPNLGSVTVIPKMISRSSTVMICEWSFKEQLFITKHTITHYAFHYH